MFSVVLELEARSSRSRLRWRGRWKIFEDVVRVRRNERKTRTGLASCILTFGLLIESQAPNNYSDSL